ncbi:MAG: flippase-like domain-containing protein [Rhizobiales bacterium]|nr:flippase-like domain-containing protein [Hyphomicrobiales bacterium]MBO6699633.1 flippase-like domain-containing protein [Hyphomicrobiales bacterium]MBO6737171.1 flippase-like domain-containing protein [Hyphomicrobiales bacterium]MBO6911755.1 flippase-like domain-containing protein [Hyphomicrobiales bacterium]MBO6954692.1 flippase-like domain-containing protein [Hyphomicrobiales bacterium]
MTTGVLSLSPGLMRFGQLAATIGLLALLWRIADGPETARILSTAEPIWLVAAIGALTVQTVLSAARWRLTAGQLGIKLPAMHALHEYYLAQMVNQAVPGGVVGDAGRAVRSRGQAGLLAAGQAVIFERLAGQIAMFLAMASAFLATLLIPGGFDWPAWLVPPVLLMIAVGFALPAALFAGANLPGRIGAKVMGLWKDMGHALAAPNVLPMQIVLSAGTTLCNLAAFAFCARAVGVVLPPVVILALVPLILFTMLIPLTISGWGVREGAAAALFPLAGATASEGFAASVAFGLVLLVAVLPGLLTLWLRSQEDG